MVGKKACPLAARIKKIMQKDEDVGKISQATPVLIGRAMELLLKKICGKTYEIAAGRQARTISSSHVKQCVMSEETMDFLKDVVASAPDLAAEEPPKPAAAKTKRRRAEESTEDDGTMPSPSEKPKRKPGRPKQQPEQTEDTEAAAEARPKRVRKKKVHPTEDDDGGGPGTSTNLEVPTQIAVPAPPSGDTSTKEDTVPLPNMPSSTITQTLDQSALLSAGLLQSCESATGMCIDPLPPGHATETAGTAASNPSSHNEPHEIAPAAVPAPPAAAAAPVSSQPANGNPSKVSLRSRHPLSLRSTHPLAIQKNPLVSPSAADTEAAAMMGFSDHHSSAKAETKHEIKLEDTGSIAPLQPSDPVKSEAGQAAAEQVLEQQAEQQLPSAGMLLPTMPVATFGAASSLEEYDDDYDA